MPFPYHRRNLPHVVPDAVPILFTWRLHGSLPSAKMLQSSAVSGEEFREISRALARASRGPVWLKQPEVAEMVCREIECAATEHHRYTLLEYVVMPNHVHLLAVPHVDPSETLRILKGVTARSANQILGRTGLPFWQDETFDHWVRHVGELTTIRDYIANDPVKCGLASRASDYPWSSVHGRLARKRKKLVQRESIV